MLGVSSCCTNDSLIIMEIIPCWILRCSIESRHKCFYRHACYRCRRKSHSISRIIDIIFCSSCITREAVVLVYIFLTFASRNKIGITYSYICSNLPSFSETLFEDISYNRHLCRAFFFFSDYGSKCEHIIKCISRFPTCEKRGIDFFIEI